MPLPVRHVLSLSVAADGKTLASGGWDGVARLSPLRAAYEHVTVASEFLAYKRSVWVNNALPSVVISPGEIISEEERDRLEAAWLQKFSRGGNGRVLVAESNLSVALVNPSMGDVAALAEAGATKE